MDDPDHPKFRLLIDANVLISHLLGGGAESTIGQTLRIAFGWQFELIVPADLIRELRDCRRKPYLASKITDSLVTRMVDDLEYMGTVVQPGRMDHSRILRDRGDDYLLSTAVLNDVEIIVSGDKHLLNLRGLIDRPRIMSPADFVAEFGESSK